MNTDKIFRPVSCILLSILIVASLSLLAQAPPGARALLPAKADLQRLGFSGWLPPWEFKDFQSGNLRYQAFPSEDAYFAASELAKFAASKKAALLQFQAIPDDQIADMKAGLEQRLAVLDQEKIQPFQPFPPLNQQISLDLIDLVQQNKFSKQAMVEAYQKRLEPLDSAAEIAFASVRSPQPNDPKDFVRSGRINVRLYLYSPAYVKAHPAEFNYSSQDAVYFEKKLTDFYVNTAKLLLKSRGQELESELQEILKIPSSARQSAQNDKIAELNDSLEALDTLQKSNPTINSSLLPYGEVCLIVRSVYTYPEGKRPALAKSGGDISTMISAGLRQGSAVAHVELITNDNALYSADRMNALLELMAQKLQGFRF